MAEQATNPLSLDMGVSDRSIEDRMAAFVDSEATVADQDTDEPAEVTAQQESPPDPDNGEPTADDLPDDAPVVQSADEAWEIVHNGQQVKLNREEVIRHAQQGFDYTQKTQEVAKKRAEADAILQRASQLEQFVPKLAQEMAQVAAFEKQLQQYSNVDWVGLATNDPLEYPKWRAQYDQLAQGYQAAQNSLHQKASAVASERQELTAQQMQHERANLVERIPSWKDPAKYQAGAAELAAYLEKEGATPQELSMLNSALAVSIAHKARLYDQLKQAKTEKSKQLKTLPPVPRPGAPTSATADNSEKARKQFQKSRSRDDAVGLLLTRMK